MQFCLVVVILFYLCCCFHPSSSIPVQYVVKQGDDECLFEKVKKDDSFTVSVFVLGGSRLSAEMSVIGPIAPWEADSSAAILEGIEKYKRGDIAYNTEKGGIKFLQTANFENFNVVEDSNVVAQQHQQEPPPEGETPEQARYRRSAERRKALEASYRQDKLKQSQKKKIREEGKPIQKTFPVQVEGWYQFCVHARHSTITVELDFRNQVDYGGLNSEGHVWTLEEKALGEDEKFMEKDSAVEEGIKDADFESTREKLKTLRRLLADIQNRQMDERRRIMLHSATNEHSHSRMVLSSLLETILFMLVTGFQVFTIRRWFKGAPALGR